MQRATCCWLLQLIESKPQHLLTSCRWLVYPAQLAGVGVERVRKPHLRSCFLCLSLVSACSGPQEPQKANVMVVGSWLKLNRVQPWSEIHQSTRPRMNTTPVMPLVVCACALQVDVSLQCHWQFELDRPFVHELPSCWLCLAGNRPAVDGESCPIHAHTRNAQNPPSYIRPQKVPLGDWKCARSPVLQQHETVLVHNQECPAGAAMASKSWLVFAEV